MIRQMKAISGKCRALYVVIFLEIAGICWKLPKTTKKLPKNYQKKVIANANITMFVEWKHDIVPTMYLYERRMKFIMSIN